MNDEGYKPAISHYDLEHTEVDWSKINAEEVDAYKWSFAVPDRETGRKIALVYCKYLGTADNSIHVLENPEPIDDLRLGFGQISFSEYDDELGSGGPIELIEIYVRDDPDEEYYARYRNGIDVLLSKIHGVPTNVNAAAMQSQVAETTETLHADSIDSILTSLKNDNIFSYLRTAQIGFGNFFDPESGNLAEDDQSDTGNVLDMFLEALQEGDPAASKSLLEDEREKLKTALAPNSESRKVLLAYYAVDEETPWAETVNHIMDAQAYKNPDFPTPQDTLRTLENLK